MADKTPKHRQPKDFDQNKVTDIEITDPDRAARERQGIPVDREFPQHLHKFVGQNQPHEYVVVTNAKEAAARRKEGWMSPQEADAVGRQQAEDAASDKAPKAPKAPKAAKASDAAPKPKRAAKAKGKTADSEPGAPAAN